MQKSRFRVAVTVEAIADLRQIDAHLGLQSARLALHLVRQSRVAASELADRAVRYALVPHREETGVRRRIVSSYDIYYRLNGDIVEVLRILHQARDHESILFPEA